MVVKTHQAVLVVYKLDRLARNTKDALDICDQLEKRKADLASITEQINTRSPLGKFFFTILAAFAALEREQIKARTSAAMQHYQAKGRRMTRSDRCPFGQRPNPADPGRLIDDPEEQAAIARIVAERQAGKSLCAIAQALTAAEVPCRGAKWYHTTVRAILDRCRAAEAPVTPTAV